MAKKGERDPVFARTELSRLLHDFDGICKAADWTNEFGYKRRIPSFCIQIDRELKIIHSKDENDSKPVSDLLPADSMIGVAEMNYFFSSQPKIRKAVVFIGTRAQAQEFCNYYKVAELIPVEIQEPSLLDVLEED